jgi:hypothetical protein
MQKTIGTFEEPLLPVPELGKDVGGIEADLLSFNYKMLPTRITC